MNQLFRFLMCFSLVAMMACSDDDPVVPQPPKPEKGDIVLEGMTSKIDVPQQNLGGVLSISFTAPDAWVVSFADATRFDNWVEVNPHKGMQGENRVEMRIMPNSTAQERVMEIEFSAGPNWRHLIVVKQEAGKQPENPEQEQQPEISIEPNRFAISAEGGELKTRLTANCAWKASFPEWVEVIPKAGEGDAEVVFRVAPYADSDTERELTITFEGQIGDKTASEQVFITQAAKPVEQHPEISVAPNRFTISAEGGELKTSLTANCAWRASFPEWVEVIPREGEGDAEVVLRVAPYENSDTERMLTVAFEGQIGEQIASEQVLILQEPKPVEEEVKIDVEPHTIYAPSVGGTFSAHILTDASWSMLLNNQLEVSPTEGFGITTVEIKVPQNKEQNPHTYVLSFAAGQGEQRKTVDLTIEQDAAPQTLTYPTLDDAKAWVAGANRDYNTFLAAMLPVLQQWGGTGEIFNNYNPSSVTDGLYEGKNAKCPTFTIDRPVFLVSVHTYHYFLSYHPIDVDGIVNAGVESWLEAADGTTYGREAYTDWFWGQGGMTGACWNTFPMVEIPAGTYTVHCSYPSTWSYNIESENEGFVLIYGMQL